MKGKDVNMQTSFLISEGLLSLPLTGHHFYIRPHQLLLRENISGHPMKSFSSEVKRIKVILNLLTKMKTSTALCQGRRKEGDLVLRSDHYNAEACVTVVELVSLQITSKVISLLLVNQALHDSLSVKCRQFLY